MKSCRFIWIVLAVLASLSFLAGCGTGEAEQVSSCTECRGSEYCVSAGGALYCADPCLRHIDCAVGFWCVPEVDEEDTSNIAWVCMPERYYTGDGRVWSWGSVSCATGGGDECPVGMECLLDDTGMTDQYFCSDPCSLDANCLTGCCYNGDYCAPEIPYCTSGDPCDACSQSEACVSVGGNFYCADYCLSHLDCDLGFWCVPETEEDTGYKAWVCVDETIYPGGTGRVWYWGESNCAEGGGNECPVDMTCLVDDTGATDEFFCSDSCSLDADCLSGCCYDTGSAEYCAPEIPYCQ